MPRGAYDDVARGEASGDPARLDRAPLVGGPPALGARDIPSERGAQVPAHVSATGHDIERVTLGVEANVLPDEPNGRFAHVLDPEGTKIELWQPKPMAD